MGIDIELQRETGRMVERVGDPDDLFSEAIPSAESDYVWLSTIDRWGDTTFNHLQVDQLVAELDRRVGEVDPRAAALLSDVKRLALLTRQEAGLYLKFLGD